MHKSFIRKGAAVVVAVLMVLSVGAASAQTQGMERRDDRRDDRSGARDTKQECKAGDENSRAECRQEKRGDQARRAARRWQEEYGSHDDFDTVTLGGAASARDVVPARAPVWPSYC